MDRFSGTLHFARENLRTTRELFPRKAWEFLNRLFLDTRTVCDHDFNAANRFEFLSECDQQMPQDHRTFGLKHGAG